MSKKLDVILRAGLKSEVLAKFQLGVKHGSKDGVLTK
jgi:hypothetical protein